MTVVESATHRARPSADESPHRLGFWTGAGISLAFAAALLPPAIVVAVERGNSFFEQAALALLVVLLWHGVFALRRKSLSATGAFVTALTFAVMLEPGAAMWHVFLALSFGVVVGELIFGGRGLGFLNPTVVALAFLYFSFPASADPQIGTAVSLASLPGAAVLLATCLISWRVLAAALFAFLALGLLLQVDDPLGQLTVGAFAFGLVFLACDPVSAASTNPGRVVYGLLIGAMTMLARASGAGDGTVFAILIGSVFAPLIDQTVIAVNARLRRRRNG